MKMEKDLILSLLKTYCKETFIAITTDENGALSLRFPNGQKFLIGLEEIS